MILLIVSVTANYIGGYLQSCDLIMFGTGVLDTNNEVIPARGFDISTKTVISRKAIVDYLFGEFNPYKNPFFCVWDKLFLKSIIDCNNIRFENRVTLGEDQIFVLNYLIYTTSFHYENKPFALKLHWKREERVSSLGVSLRSPEEYIFIQRRNYAAFERLLNKEPNDSLKKYKVNYIIDRPITRILYRYVLLENCIKCSYPKLQKFTELYILPTLRLEKTNISEVRDKSISNIADMLFTKPFFCVYIQLFVSRNTSALKDLITRIISKLRKL